MKRADFRTRMRNPSGVYITTAPRVSQISSTSATITWSLSSTASGSIDYGTTTAYGATNDSGFFALNHQLTLPVQGGTALTANTTYHYRIYGEDIDGHAYDSGDRTFTTEAAPAGSDFLDRPSSGALTYSGLTNVTISNIAIDLGTLDNVGGNAISLYNCQNITITDVDIANAIGGIYLYQCSGTIAIDNLRSRNIGAVTMVSKDECWSCVLGAGKSNHIQFADSQMEGYVRNSKFLGGQTEDMLSTWHSGGYGVGSEIVFENNELQGLVTDSATARAWDSESGTGIILSDGGGYSKNGNIIVRNNTFLTPGQVGIQFIDGPNLQVYQNIIYGEFRPQMNNPATSWEGYPIGEFHDNTYWWTDKDGANPDPWFAQYGDINSYDNTKDAGLDPNDYVVTL